MNITVDIQDPTLLHVGEQIIEQDGAATIDITPQSLYSLIVNASPTDKTTPTRASLGQSQHVRSYSNISTASVSTHSTWQAIV